MIEKGPTKPDLIGIVPNIWTCLQKSQWNGKYLNVYIETIPYNSSLSFFGLSPVAV